MENLLAWVSSVVLLSLRIAPVFAFAPPFTLVRTPLLFRLLFGLGMSACILSWTPVAAPANVLSGGAMFAAGARELLLGVTFLVAFQLTFAALQLAGRTVDIQAGFGLATFIDPTTKAGMPLVGTLFAYSAGAVFFAMDGHVELLHLLSTSLEAVPLGAYEGPASLSSLFSFIAVVFVAAFGVAGAVIVALFLADLAIALMSRTVPQMNVLILGFQVKTIILLVVLAVTLGTATAQLGRVTRVALEALPGIV